MEVVLYWVAGLIDVFGKLVVAEGDDVWEASEELEMCVEKSVFVW